MTKGQQYYFSVNTDRKDLNYVCNYLRYMKLKYPDLEISGRVLFIEQGCKINASIISSVPIQILEGEGHFCYNSMNFAPQTKEELERSMIGTEYIIFQEYPQALREIIEREMKNLNTSAEISIEWDDKNGIGHKINSSVPLSQLKLIDGPGYSESITVDKDGYFGGTKDSNFEIIYDSEQKYFKLYRQAFRDEEIFKKIQLENSNGLNQTQLILKK